VRRRADYGRVLPLHQWQGISRRRRIWNALRWWLGAALVAGIAWYWLGGAQRIGPASMPPGPSERIDAKFTELVDDEGLDADEVYGELVNSVKDVVPLADDEE
jgi:hypothetical protein